MRRATAIETSSVLVVTGAIMAVALDARAGGITAELVGWILVGLGVWCLALFTLVGTTATTAVSTTFLEAGRPVVRGTPDRHGTHQNALR